MGHLSSAITYPCKFKIIPYLYRNQKFYPVTKKNLIKFFPAKKEQIAPFFKEVLTK